MKYDIRMKYDVRMKHDVTMLRGDHVMRRGSCSVQF